MVRRTFLPIGFTLLQLALAAPASAQTRVAKESPATHQVDTAHVQKIFISDLEMIDPENRLIPESNAAKAQPMIVESPLSASRRATPPPAGKITTNDLQALESIESPADAGSAKQAADQPSR